MAAPARRKSLFPNQPSAPLAPNPGLQRPNEPVAPLLPLLALLAGTVALGTLWSLSTSDAVISIRSRIPAAALDAAQAARANGAFPATPPLPYFADKRNFLNVVFVKLGWFWTSLAAGVYILVSYSFPPSLSTRSTVSPKSPFLGQGPDSKGDHPWTAELPPVVNISNLTRRMALVAHLRRLALSTGYWWLLTQSTLRLPLSKGPSVAQHILAATGGVCVGPGGSACTGRTGEFLRGGHDVSGHAFLLVHATLLLASLVYPTVVAMTVGPAPPTNELLGARNRVVPSRAMKSAAVGVVALILLWWWMLLMTSMYFHSPAEKLSGFAFGVAGWWIGRL